MIARAAFVIHGVDVVLCEARHLELGVAADVAVRGDERSIEQLGAGLGLGLGLGIEQLGE